MGVQTPTHKVSGGFLGRLFFFYENFPQNLHVFPVTSAKCFGFFSPKQRPHNHLVEISELPSRWWLRIFLGNVRPGSLGKIPNLTNLSLVFQIPPEEVF